MNVSLRHLRAFVAVARQGSFTAAATELCLTQSTLTKTIREFEAMLGVDVLERNTRRLSLTSYGASFFVDAVRILNDLELALKGINEQVRGCSGTVHVASGLAFGSTVMPRVIQALHAREPGIHVSLIDDTSGGVIRRIESGEVDVGIGSYIGMAGSVLNARLLLTARLGVVYPAGLTNVPVPLTLKDLSELAILRDADDSSIAAALRQYAPLLWERMARRVTVTSLDMQLALVRDGIGACVISALAASHPGALGLPYRLIESPVLQRDVYVFTRREVSLLPAAARFLEILTEVLPTIDFVDGVQLASDVVGAGKSPCTS
ncbi:LysR family transcriptional regulator [Burkholderia sp. RF4-BP95]|uniref:LysR family transcriptional regulator n=1 Tax=Burkholderia sp. RF4-BP95 TaxID=1637845 RepID=UPI00075544F4|nr:LysR family transcriptional regulator [Burkholderia sp. RF4-BP95]KUY84071.1 LysR family transcriptional regulator [Burkholderia sp. RF4-BP95]